MPRNYLTKEDKSKLAMIIGETLASGRFASADLTDMNTMIIQEFDGIEGLARHLKELFLAAKQGSNTRLGVMRLIMNGIKTEHEMRRLGLRDAAAMLTEEQLEAELRREMEAVIPFYDSSDRLLPMPEGPSSNG